MEKIKGPICHTEVGERKLKETYVSSYNNKSTNATSAQIAVHWWEPLKIIPKFYVGNVV